MLYKCFVFAGLEDFLLNIVHFSLLVQCWAIVADVGLILKQRWVVSHWSSIQSCNQVTESTTLYCMLKAYTHASLERDSIFKVVSRYRDPQLQVC